MARVPELESWDRPRCDLELTLSLCGCLFFCKEKGVIIITVLGIAVVSVKRINEYKSA